jgi:hypothetical protein
MNKLEAQQEVQLAKAILDWKEPKLTWTDVEDLSAQLFGYRFTRQTLSSRKHEHVRDAYKDKTRVLRKGRPGPRKTIPRANLDEISALRLRIRVLLESRDRANERFLRWSTNAFQAGMTLEALDRPLSKASRPQRSPSTESLEALEREIEARTKATTDRRTRIRNARSKTASKLN